MNPDCPEMRHCLDKIRQIVTEGRDDRRAVLQLGYNLGRLSELTGLGRGPFWDAWKEAVAAWDLPILMTMARDLPMIASTTSPSAQEPASS